MADIKISVESQLYWLSKQLEGFRPRDLDFITRRALNSTGDRTLKHLQSQIPKYIDRPTPFVTRSFYVRGIRKGGDQQSVSLEWRDFNGKGFGMGRALAPNVEGGDRKAKGMEAALSAFGYLPKGWKAIPTKDAPKDAFGNVPGRFIVQLLSYLRADRSGTQNRPAIATTTRQRTRQAKRQSRFFVVVNGHVVGSGARGARGTKLPDGIYERIATGFGQAFRQIFFYVSDVSYQKRFPFYELADKHITDVFPLEFEKAVEIARKAQERFKK